jgi:asparagine synthase (glutamine-hydrolysing)
MCGISGHLTLRGEPDISTVAAQIATLRHRGPDAEGWYEGRHGLIAQNRLAIIDLVTGDPPITNEAGDVGVVLNGEIYNFRELRTALLSRGHRFSTVGDTEVIAHLLEDEDPAEVARRLDGMFSFAAWDARSGRLVIARDRLGKKPLYYWAGPDDLVFGSELKAVLAHPRVPRELEPSAIPAYLTFGYVPTPRTFYRGIVSLPPGHVLVAEPGREPVVTRYWDLPAPPPRRVSMDEAAREVRDGLRSAIRKRLIADVPLGAFLSGGVDSSAVVALASEETSEPLQTFTIGFEDSDGFDERPFARMVAQRFGTDHHEFVVEPHAVDLVERLVWHHDQPFGDSSAIPTFLLSELTRQHVTVALSGDGGDELFAGYERFVAGVAMERYQRVPRALRLGALAGLRRVPRSALGGRVGSVERFATRADLGMPDAYLDWISYVGIVDQQRLVEHDDDWARRQYRELYSATAGRASLERLLDLNIRTYLLDDLLVKVDRMSMAHGLEVRSPFLDTELLTMAASLPPALKQRAMSLKRVVVAAMRGLVPDEVMDRPKRGFGVPLDRWFREDLGTLLSSTLGSPRAALRRHVRDAALDAILSEHASGVRDHGHALWTLLTLELFLQREGLAVSE